MERNKMNEPKVIENHDYLRINLGNNRGLTVSYSGCKATGKVPNYIFDLWDKCTSRQWGTPAVVSALKQIGITEEKIGLGVVTHAFAKAIPTLWPEWNKAAKLPAIGTQVTYNFGKRQGTDTGVVEKIRGTNVTIRFKNQGLISMAADMLEEYSV